MSAATEARVPTTSGSRYLQQLCKHWSHNMAVEFDATQGKVTFPREMRGGAVFPTEALVTFTAEPETLVVRIEGSSTDHVDRLKRPVESHLDRFAFREAPLPFEWRVA